MDNSFHEESALHVSNDYYSYVGITRLVVIKEIDEMFIKYVHFIPYRENKKWYASISASISNLSDEQKNVTLQIKIGDEVVSFEDKVLQPNAETLFENTFEFSFAITYTLENPKLYMMNAMLLFIKDSLDTLKNFVNSTDGAGKTLLISEIGAGAMYGFRSNNMEKWTEEYQQHILAEQLTSILSDEDLSGVIIWQYADCRVDNGWFH